MRLQEGDSLDELLTEPALHSVLHTLAGKIVEATPHLQYRSLRPCALHGLAVVASEWIMHVTGTSTEALDELVTSWGAVSQACDQVELKKRQIEALNLPHLLKVVPAESIPTRDQIREEIRAKHADNVLPLASDGGVRQILSPFSFKRLSTQQEGPHLEHNGPLGVEQASTVRDTEMSRRLELLEELRVEDEHQKALFRAIQGREGPRKKRTRSLTPKDPQSPLGEEPLRKRARTLVPDSP